MSLPIYKAALDLFPVSNINKDVAEYKSNLLYKRHLANLLYNNETDEFFKLLDSANRPSQVLKYYQNKDRHLILNQDIQKYLNLAVELNNTAASIKLIQKYRDLLIRSLSEEGNYYYPSGLTKIIPYLESGQDQIEELDKVYYKHRTLVKSIKIAIQHNNFEIVNALSTLTNVEYPIWYVIFYYLNKYQKLEYVRYYLDQPVYNQYINVAYIYILTYEPILKEFLNFVLKKEMLIDRGLYAIYFERIVDLFKDKLNIGYIKELFKKLSELEVYIEFWAYFKAELVKSLQVFNVLTKEYNLELFKLLLDQRLDLVELRKQWLDFPNIYNYLQVEVNRKLYLSYLEGLGM